MKVLVCGGRDFTAMEMVNGVLNAIHRKSHIDTIIHGGARGADQLAGKWAKSYQVNEICCPADWDKHGKKAGVLRNSEMLKHDPDFFVAFPGGRGTADMSTKARERGIRGLVILHV